MINSRASSIRVNSGIRNDIPNTRTSSFQTGILSTQTGNSHAVGTPLGLLLALTYSVAVTDQDVLTFRSDFRPNNRIE